MKTTCAAVLSALICLTAVAQTLDDATMTWENVVTGLSLPTSFEFIDESNPNEFWVTEKNTGRVRHVRNGVIGNTVLDLPVATAADRGLLSLVKSPDFNQTGHIFLFYSFAIADGGTWVENRIERYTWNGTAMVDPVLIWSTLFDPSQPNGDWHQGGVLLFGPDKKLYFPTGDLHRGRLDNGRIEQNTHGSAVAGVGGILRLNPDGSTPDDNPFVEHASDAIRRMWVYGLRNCFGMAFDSLTGLLWFTENGPDKYDEINIARKGLNSGWLKIVGPDSRNAIYFENNNTAYNAADLTMLPGAIYRDPEFSWVEPIGPITMLFLRSQRFDANWRDHAIFDDSNHSELYRLLMNNERDGFALTGGLADKVADHGGERLLLKVGTGFWTCTDSEIGADGYAYLLSLAHGRVIRLRPVNPPTVINGRVELADYAGSMIGVPLTIELRQGQTVVETLNTTLDVWGKFSVRVAAPGNYTAYVKPSKWLANKILGVSLTSGGYAYLKFASGSNGDVNGDNIVDDSDLGAVLEAFGTDNAAADLNGDGIVDDTDLSIVLEAFGLQGED